MVRLAVRNNIFLSAMFRSGSTHVKTTLCDLLGYRHASTVMHIGERGNDSDRIDTSIAQVLFPMQQQVFHQHTLGTSGNEALLETFGLRPVVMIRNMLDSMVSLRELLVKNEIQHLGVYTPRDFHVKSRELQYEWLAYNLSGWYFSFYETWSNVKLPVLFLRYDDYYRDQVAGIRSILKHVEMDKELTVSDEVILRNTKTREVGSRFNRGVSGRGSEIPERLVSHMRRQSRSWGAIGDLMIEELIDR